LPAGFFDDIQEPQATSSLRARYRPDGTLPTPLPIRLLLARTSDAAIAVVGLLAFPVGFEFLVTAQLKRAVPGTPASSFLGALDDEPLDDDFLRLGLQFSTGEKVANTQPMATREGTAELPGPILKIRAGGGGLLSRDWKYWVSPLPSPGPLTFVCEWPAFGIPESRAEIDAQLILAAAQHRIDLWS
jgi:hypothetical protein